MTNLKITTTLMALMYVYVCHGQHNNEFYNDGALVHVQAGAEVHVWGDVHMRGAAGMFENYGLVKMQGNAYSDNLFQQRGTGTFRVENSNVNVGERQFISGSYAVRGGQAITGVNDGSFYNLELANSQGIVYLTGAGNIADVRNNVNFLTGGPQNRIITHDVGMLGALVYPANGSGYSATFGIMNPTAGLGSMTNNSVSSFGNMSGVDSRYVQGRLRRAISAAGGIYGFVFGLEPAGAGAQRGMQYIHLDIAANNYDVINGYFQTGSPNSMAPPFECGGNYIDYFGGVDHGEWMFSSSVGGSAGTYQVQLWPQDDNYIVAPIWVITKDNSMQGTANQCGPSPVGLLRSGFNGFVGPSEFNVAAPTSVLPIELIDINAQGIVDHIDVTWNVASEVNLSHYELERSEDGGSFEYLATIDAIGGANMLQSYVYHDLDVRYFQNYYYRVKSVDYNGSSDYSPTVVASIQNQETGLDENSVVLYPNPSFSDFSMSIFTSESLQLEMEIHNSIGQLVSTRIFVAQAGNTVISVASEEWAPAVYHITLRDVHTGQTINKRFIKQ